MKRKALVSLVQARDCANLQECRSKLYRAKDSIVNMLNGAWVESFSYIPALLLELRDKNPGTTVRLEVDQHRRFLRGFVAFGADVSSQPWLSPLLGFDGTHSKHPKYNGIILSLVGRDGNGQNVTLATALVNVESESNITWLLGLCVEAGISFDENAVFCDRGNIRGAARQLYQAQGMHIELRFCIVHILRNVKRQFRCNGRDFENAVWKVQGAENDREYRVTVEAIRTKFGQPVASYIQEINPGHWTVHASMNSYLPVPLVDDSIPTLPLPMFG
jgi:hypothetical protein